MTPEEIQALKDSTKAEVEAAFSDKIKSLETSLNGVVEELKTERKTKQEIEAERDALKTKNTNPGSGDATDVDAKIQEALAKKDELGREAIKNNSIKKFKETHKEFHPDNDPGGVKYAAFERKLARINLNGLTSEDDFNEAFEDALVILNKGTTEAPASQQNPYASSAQHTPSPKSTSTNNLTPLEIQIVKDMGWDEARYLKIKASRPQYVASLIKFKQSNI